MGNGTGRLTRARRQKPASLLCTLLTLCLVASACSTDGQAGSGDDGGAASDKPTAIKIFVDYTIAQPPAPGNPVWREFEERTNTKLDIQWIPGPDYADRLNVALAAGDLADLIKIPNVTTPLFREMVRQGAFWDLTPYVGDYPNLMAMDESIWNNTKINGKSYAVPSGRPMDGGGFAAIRQDWLDQLGLDMPETMDELYDVLKAFKEQKPDGKQDTTGYTMRSAFFLEEVFTGTSGKWKAVDGALVDMTLEPEMRESLLYKRKLYEDGLIPIDYPVLRDTQFWELATSGRAGMTGETPEALFRWTMDQWKANPEVDWTPMPYLKAHPDSPRYAPKSTGYNGVLAIPKSVPEEKMKAILAFIDYGSGGEGLDLTLYGIEGIHYNVEDGFKIATEKAVSDSVGTGSWGKMFATTVLDLWQFAAGMPKEVYERNVRMAKEKAEFSVQSPAIGLASETEMKLGADYNKKIEDLKTQVTIGKASIEQWDSYVAELKSDATYQKIIAEMNEAYQVRNSSVGSND